MLDSASVGIGCCMPVLPTTITRPHFRSRIAGSRALVIRIGETTMCWNHSSSAGSVIWLAVQGGGPPWFSTRMSTPPMAFTAASARRSMSALLATSATTPEAAAAPAAFSSAAAWSSLPWSRPLMTMVGALGGQRIGDRPAEALGSTHHQGTAALQSEIHEQTLLPDLGAGRCPRAGNKASQGGGRGPPLQPPLFLWLEGAGKPGGPKETSPWPSRSCSSPASCPTPSRRAPAATTTPA